MHERSLLLFRRLLIIKRCHLFGTAEIGGQEHTDRQSHSGLFDDDVSLSHIVIRPAAAQSAAYNAVSL
jgi:hypothetical protein